MCDCLAQQCERKGGEETGRGRETKSIVSPANSLTPHATNSACAQIIVSCLLSLVSLVCWRGGGVKGCFFVMSKAEAEAMSPSAAALKTHQPLAPPMLRFRATVLHVLLFLMCWLCMLQLSRSLSLSQLSSSFHDFKRLLVLEFSCISNTRKAREREGQISAAPYWN